MLVACYCVFNEAWNIARSLDSVRLCDRIVVLDGAFEGFPCNRSDGRSDDGTLKIVSEWLTRWTEEDNRRDGWLAIPNRPWPSQMIKRSFYFRFGCEGDWFLVIDGDEVVESGLQETKDLLEQLEGEAYWVSKEIVQKQSDPHYYVERSGLSPRLFQFREGLCYGNTYDDFPQFPVKTLPLIMRHLRFPPIRDTERRVIKSQHQTSADFARVTLIKNPDRRRAGMTVRLFRFQRGLRYKDNHYSIMNSKGEFICGESPLQVPLTLEVVPRLDNRDELMSDYDEYRTRNRIETE